MGKRLSSLLRAIAISLTVGACLLLSYEFVMLAEYGLRDLQDAVQWRDKTSPLDEGTIKDICFKFGIPAVDPRCQPGAKVYAPDFFRVIRKAFQPQHGVWATYAEVQEKLGKYQYHYEPPVTTAAGFTYFVAGYDLQGDRVYPIGMFFYADGRLWRLMADTSN